MLTWRPAQPNREPNARMLASREAAVVSATVQLTAQMTSVPPSVASVNLIVQRSSTVTQSSITATAFPIVLTCISCIGLGVV